MEYEALLLGLQMLKKLGAKRISIHVDSELVIKQVKGLYAAKHPRMRAYKNAVLDFLRTFEEYDLAVIPRNQNVLVNGLAFLASTCNLPHPNKPHIIEVKHRPSVPDYMRFWQVFGSDKKIESFLQSKDEFEESNVDMDCEEDTLTDEQCTEEKQTAVLEKTVLEVNNNVNIPTNNTVHNYDSRKDLEKEEFKILQLKDNNLPRGLVPLEELFDCNDVAKKTQNRAN